MERKIHIHTYGCQMNDYESDRTYRLFQDQHGYRWTHDPSLADLVLFNTCSIREKADQKAFSAIGGLRDAKAAHPGMVIAVGGCLAQSQGEWISKRFPFVDIVFGTHQWASLPMLVDRVRRERQAVSELDLFGWNKYAFLPRHRSKTAHPVSDLVTIQNGCDKFCTFCLVPFTRGRQVSRLPEDILEEVRMLVENGVREVTLLGQNVNAYGADRRGEISFADLLRRIDAIPGLERLRFVTSHPSALTYEAIDAMADSRTVCEQIHLPIQSGSDRILESMNRDYTLARYRELVAYLRKRMPGMPITTDIIVGFPGETEEDFEKTLAALEEFRFDDSYSFSFSPRLNTKAAQWTEAFVPPSIAKERLIRLKDLQAKISQEDRSKQVGRTVEVLVEGMAPRRDGLLTGKTRENWFVNFSGPAHLIGRLVPIRLVQRMSNTFRGEWCAPTPLPVKVA